MNVNLREKIKSIYDQTAKSINLELRDGKEKRIIIYRDNIILASVVPLNLGTWLRGYINGMEA